MDRVQHAPDNTRARIEGVAGRVVAFTERDILGETALRAACSERPDLLTYLERTLSLEERALHVLLADPSIFNRASNIAAGHGWRGGRQHCAFHIEPGSTLTTVLEEAVSSIATVIQATQGGRQVDSEHFIYPDLFSTDAGEITATTPVVHHIAVYVEASASYWLEFEESQPRIAPVLRREAHEIAIDYYPESGDLHVAGKGVGGSKTLEEIAEIFGTEALVGARVQRVERMTWHLDVFRSVRTPVLTPPEGYGPITIEEVAFRNSKRKSALVSYKGGEGRDAYTRMRELGLTQDKLAAELVRSVTLRFTTLADTLEDERRIRATLSWPSTLSFDSAMPADRRSITKWAGELGANR